MCVCVGVCVNEVHQVVVHHSGLLQGQRCADHGKLRLQARSKLAALLMIREREAEMLVYIRS